MIYFQPPSIHPASGRAAKYLMQQIKSGAGGTNDKALLHALLQLKDILGVFSKSDVQATCETVLGVMRLGNAMTVSCGMQALHALFNSRPGPTSLPAELNAQLVSALYDYLPSVNDSQPFIAWLTVQQEALINLSFQDVSLCWAHLPKFYNTATQVISTSII